MDPGADVTIVVPTLGRVERALTLAARLESLRPSPQRALFVFQVPGELSEWQRRNQSPGSEGILAPARGSSVARNVGAKHAKTKYLAFLDDDCSPTREDWLTEITKPLLTHGVLLATGPVLGWVNASSFLRGSRRAFMLSTPLLLSWGNPEAGDSSFCRTVAGGNFAVQRSVFTESGGFSEAFGSPSLYEETEFSLRVAQRHRRRIWYTSEAPVAHDQEASGGMRMVSSTPSEDFLIAQKSLLFRAVYKNDVAEVVISLFKALRRGFVFINGLSSKGRAKRHAQC